LRFAWHNWEPLQWCHWAPINFDSVRHVLQTTTWASFNPLENHDIWPPTWAAQMPQCIISHKGTVITGTSLTAAMADGPIRSLRILVAEELVFFQTQQYFTGYLQLDSHVPHDPREYPSSFVITYSKRCHSKDASIFWQYHTDLAVKLLSRLSNVNEEKQCIL